MGLSNYQLVLLDNLIYLNEVTKVEEGETTIGKLVDRLLRKEGSDKIGEGAIEDDWHNSYKSDNPNAGVCLMSKEEWVAVLLAIEADKDLCELTIQRVDCSEKNDNYMDGFRAMVLTGDHVDENIIIFRGTMSAEEWMDDAAGGYSVSTEEQEQAVKFVESLDLVDNKSFVVSGHSKGGNMAQYVALFCTNPPIDRCLSYDGQGFSNELLETDRYKNAIARRGQNLYLIASACDPVNVLFNSPVPDNHKMYLRSNDIYLNYMKNHKPNAIFTQQRPIDSEYYMYTGLTETTRMNSISIFIQDFIAYILETETDVEKKQIAFDGIMTLMATDAESNDEMKMGVSTELILALYVIPLLAGCSGNLVGINATNFYLIGLEGYLSLLDSAVADAYQRTIYNVKAIAGLDIMFDYLGQYISESRGGLYNALAMVDEVVKKGVFEDLGDDGKSILSFFWDGIVDIFDAATGGSIENWKKRFNSYAITSTLGEGTKGTPYQEWHDIGKCTLIIGTGAREETIEGTIGDDIIYGGNGRDIITGGAGHDELWGGRGNDFLNGGSGSDTYGFGKYDGYDTIKNERPDGYKDYIWFDDDVKFSEVSYKRYGNNLIIIVGEYSRITVLNYFNDSWGRGENVIDIIKFHRGTIQLTFEDICKKLGFESTDGVWEDNLSEEEKKAIEEEEWKLREWFEEHNKQKDNGATSGGESTGSGGSGTSGGSDSSGNSGASGGGNGSGGSSSGNQDTNSSNATNRAIYEIFGRDPGAYQDSMDARPADPIIIDLNGDGIFTTSLQDGTYFDLNKDGFAEKTAWVTSEDGLLVRDVNGNGQIDDGGELFGDNTVLSDGSIATSGFHALADLDDNMDGVLDAQDKSFKDLRIWIDANHNGISEKGELYTLDDFGIESIDLHYNQINRVDENGNLIKSGSNIYGADVSFDIGEYDFDVDYSDTEYRGEEIDTSGLEGYLPDIKGCGTLLDLSQAMAVNDELKRAVSRFIVETDCNARKIILQGILFLWAEVSEVDIYSRGTAMDARKLGVLEKVYGQSFVGLSGANPNSGAAIILNRLYAEFEQEVEECLLSQTAYKEALESITLYYNKNTDSYYCNFAAIIQTLVAKQSIYYIPMFVDYLLKNTKLGKIFDRQYIYEQVKAENIFWADLINMDNIVYQTNAAVVTGSNGNDLLLSGAGDGILRGGTGDDTYVFNLGSGQDIIRDSNGTDRIIFGAGIHAEDIRVSRDAKNLYLTNEKVGDRITVEDFFYFSKSDMETVEFADGTKWTSEDLRDMARYYYGTDGDDRISAYDNDRGLGKEDDYLYGGAGDDSLIGNKGNDELYGESGNDTLDGREGDDLLVGGTGNDSLRGGMGDDTYLFNIGDGQDTIWEAGGTDRIVFGEGIHAEDIRVSRDTKNLHLTNEKTGDRITIEDFFYAAKSEMETVEFADGTKWTSEDLRDMARYYYGTDGNDYISAYDNDRGLGKEDDYLYGGAGDDNLIGNKGNDELYGGSGNDSLDGREGDDLLVGGTGNDSLRGGMGDDTYLFNIGDGQDSIWEAGGTDRIVFGEGIHAEDIRVSRDTKNLHLTNEKTGDRITIEDFFYAAKSEMETVEFADGTKWTSEDLRDMARYYYGTDGNDYISAYDNDRGLGKEDDYLYGGAGDDTLYGNKGNDELYGESGNDSLDGREGDDLLVGGTGNDSLRGGMGDDTYLFNIGDGQDTIWEAGGNDRIVFGEGIHAEDIRVSRDTKNLHLTNEKTGDRITIEDFFYSAKSEMETVEFADGTKWTSEDLRDMARYYYGTDGNDYISAYDNDRGLGKEDDYLYGGAGDDTLYGNKGNDELYGESGNDTLDGREGDDLLVGGTGNDILKGGAGDDTYLFNIGDGQDTITEGSGDDQIIFGAGISGRDLAFAREGNNLKISVIGQQDTITINQYYSNDTYKVESFRTSDGCVLDYTNLDLMIQAMASFEDTTGMMWQDAIENNNEQANDIINQWWTKSAV